MEKILFHRNSHHNGKNCNPTIFLNAANIISTFLSVTAQFHSDVLYIEYSSYGFYTCKENFVCCFRHHCSWTFIHYLLLRQSFIEMLMRFWTVYSSIGVFCLGVFCLGFFFVGFFFFLQKKKVVLLMPFKIYFLLVDWDGFYANSSCIPELWPSRALSLGSSSINHGSCFLIQLP